MPTVKRHAADGVVAPPFRGFLGDFRRGTPSATVLYINRPVPIKTGSVIKTRDPFINILVLYGGTSDLRPRDTCNGRAFSTRRISVIQLAVQHTTRIRWVHRCITITNRHAVITRAREKNTVKVYSHTQ